MSGSIYRVLGRRNGLSSSLRHNRLSGLELLLFVFLSLLAGPALAENKVINENPLKASLLEVAEVLKPGGEASLKVEMNLAEKHHAYLDMFRFEISEVETLTVEGFDVAPVVEFFDKFSKKKRLGIKGQAEMAVLLTVPKHLTPGEHRAQFELTYQACTDDYCLFPKKIPLETTFQVAGEKALAATSGSEAQKNNAPPTSLFLNFNEAMNKGWWMALLVVFLAGILTSFTPCIFPMIPITLAILGTKTAGRTRLSGFLLSVIYVLGIAFTYSLLGLFAASTGALFGAFLGHPIAIGFISSIFVFMGLSMFGLFEIKLPDRWATRLSQGGGKQSYLTSFVAGLFAGIVASPCVGPVLVAILTYVAKEQDLVLGFVLLFTYALGLGLIFIALGTFSQLSQKLPRSGVWMTRIKATFGTVMMIMAVYYALPLLPKTWNPLAVHNEHSATPWQEYSTETFAKAKEQGKPVIVDFYADWCAACKELEAYTFTDPAVQELGKEFVWVQYDATTPSAEFDAIKEKYNIIGLPNVVFINSKGEWMRELTLTGFEKAEPFLERMKKAHK